MTEGVLRFKDGNLVKLFQMNSPGNQSCVLFFFSPSVVFIYVLQPGLVFLSSLWARHWMPARSVEQQKDSFNLKKKRKNCDSSHQNPTRARHSAICSGLIFEPFWKILQDPRGPRESPEPHPGRLDVLNWWTLHLVLTHGTSSLHSNGSALFLNMNVIYISLAVLSCVYQMK